MGYAPYSKTMWVPTPKWGRVRVGTKISTPPPKKWGRKSHYCTFYRALNIRIKIGRGMLIIRSIWGVGRWIFRHPLDRGQPYLHLETLGRNPKIKGPGWELIKEASLMELGNKRLFC